MPKIILPIPSTEISVTRSVVQDVMNQIKELTNIDENVRVRYAGSLEALGQYGSFAVDDGGEKTRFDSSQKIHVQVSEEYREGTLLNSAVHLHENPRIFEDSALMLLLKPIYSYTDVTIEVTYRAQNQTQAEQWKNDIRVRIADNRESNLHFVNYHYAVPITALRIIRHCYDLRENVAGYGQTFKEYLAERSTPNLITLTTSAGTQPIFVIKERQGMIQGYFDFNEPPESTKDDNIVTYTTKFTYKFSYQKPISTNLIYPLVVHNQLISDKFYTTNRAFQIDRDLELVTNSRRSFNFLEELYSPNSYPLSGIRIPEFDDWLPRSVHPYSSTLALWLLQVDQKDPTNIANFKDMDDIVVHPDIWLMMQSERTRMTKRGDSIFYFNMFVADMPEEDYLTIDENWNIISKKPLNMRSMYHLRLSLITNPALLTENAKTGLQTHGKETLTIFKTIVPKLDLDRYWPVLIATPRTPTTGDTYIPTKYFHELLNILTDLAIGVRGDNLNNQLIHKTYKIEWPLVQTLSIIAHRQGTYHANNAAE